MAVEGLHTKECSKVGVIVHNPSDVILHEITLDVSNNTSNASNIEGAVT